MPLIYLSTDELNQTLVRRWSVPMGIEVECPDPVDRAWDESCSALLLDLDHTTSEWLGTLATWLEPARRRRGRVAVHGYSAAVDAFRGRHVTVRSRLRPELLRKLVRHAGATAPERVEAESDALT
jgi:hypothetical protein